MQKILLLNKNKKLQATNTAYNEKREIRTSHVDRNDEMEMLQGMTIRKDKGPKEC